MTQAGTAAALCGLIVAAGNPRLYADAASAANPAPSTTQASQGKTVTIRLTNADIYTVINQFQNQTKMDVAVVPGDLPYKLINVYLDRVTPDVALRNIAASAGAAVTVNSDGVYVLRPLSQTSDLTADPSTPQTATYQSATPDPSAPREPVAMHKLFLKYSDPKDILIKMGWTQTMQPGDFPSNADRDKTDPRNSFTALGNPVNILPMPAYPQPYGQPSPYQQPTVPAGHGNTGNSQANDDVSAGRSVDPNGNAQAQQFPGGGGGFGGGGFGGGGFGGGGFGGGGRGGFGGGGFGQGGLGPNGQQQAVLPEGVDRLYAIEGDNSLLVFATAAGFDLVKQIVKSLDIAPKQVSIKVEFVTASVNDIDQFGINFSLIPVPSVQSSFPVALQNPLGVNPLGATQPPSYIQFAYGNVAAQLYSLLSKSRNKLVSAPIISTTNNVQAVIEFEQNIPYTTTTTTIVPNGGAVNGTAQNLQQIISVLEVTPRINGDDTVTMELFPQIQTPNGTAAAGQPIPTASQTLETTRTVKSGETMVLGGLTTKDETYASSKIPFLGDLPIFGSLFRSRSKNNSDSELLIFVTPTIIDETASDTGITSAPQDEEGVNGAAGAQPNPGGQVAP